MANILDSISQNMQRYPLLFSGITLGAVFVFSIVTFFVLRAQTNALGYYTMSFFHICVFSLYMVYFEFKMTLHIRSAFYFCLAAHLLFLLILFIMLVYTFFLGDSFILFLQDYNYVDEVTAFKYYFSRKIGFGIGLSALFLIQVHRPT